ncbi:MAG: hypothetical protein ABI743_11440, partial [bacterium]
APQLIWYQSTVSLGNLEGLTGTVRGLVRVVDPEVTLPAGARPRFGLDPLLGTPLPSLRHQPVTYQAIHFALAPPAPAWDEVPYPFDLTSIPVAAMKVLPGATPADERILVARVGNNNRLIPSVTGKRIPIDADDWVMCILGGPYSGTPSITIVHGVPVIAVVPKDLADPVHLFIGERAQPLTPTDWTAFDVQPAGFDTTGVLTIIGHTGNDQLALMTVTDPGLPGAKEVLSIVAPNGLPVSSADLTATRVALPPTFTGDITFASTELDTLQTGLAAVLHCETGAPDGESRLFLTSRSVPLKPSDWRYTAPINAAEIEPDGNNLWMLTNTSDQPPTLLDLRDYGFPNGVIRPAEAPSVAGGCLRLLLGRPAVLTAGVTDIELYRASTSNPLHPWDWNIGAIGPLTSVTPGYTSQTLVHFQGHLVALVQDSTTRPRIFATPDSW